VDRLAANRILIADDEPLFLHTTAALLRKEGFDCTCAASGIAALEALANEKIDLVLSDLNMPGNVKLELLKEGRSKWPEIPLIVVTGAPSLPTAIEVRRFYPDLDYAGGFKAWQAEAAEVAECHSC
jgi:two-component system response regulator HydG